MTTVRLATANAVEQVDASAIVDAAPDGIAVVDDAGTLLVVNRRLGEMFGYAEGELAGRPVELLVPGGLREQRAALRATSSQQEPSTGPLGADMGLRRDGTTFPVEVALGPLRIGSHLCVIAAVRDVTERQAREAEWRGAQGVVLSAPDAILVFDRHTLRLTFVNDGALRQLGYSRQELLAMTPLDVKPAMSEAAYREIIAGLDPGTSHTYRTAHRRRDGSEIPVEATLYNPPAGVDGAPSQWLASIARDISERTESERRAVVAERDLAIAQDRQRIARDLHDRVIQRIFVAGLAASGLAAQLDDAVARERLDEVIEDLDEAIHDLRSSIFGLTVPSGGSLRQQVVELAQEYAEPLGFSPVVKFEGPVDTAGADLSTQLLAVLREALANVSRHAGSSNVVVTVTAEEGIAVCVEDDGTGLPPLRHSGRGLANMAERAASLGGSFAAGAGSLGGTRIVWRVPWDRPGPSSSQVSGAIF